MLVVQECVANLGQCGDFHVRARRTFVRGEESLARILASQSVQDSDLRRHDELVCVGESGSLDHPFGGKDLDALGIHVTGRDNIHVWMGECHVHAGIDPENIRLQRRLHPEAEFLIHPECGCSTSVIEAMSAGDVDAEGVQILSTEGMIKRPKESAASDFIVATEVGILHRLRRENPSKRFFAANERASCAYMKVTTLPKVLRSLETMQYPITVPPDVAARARGAIERMIAIGGRSGPALSPVPETIDPGE